MPPKDRAEPEIEILLPDGTSLRPERRRHDTTFRPYSQRDGRPPGRPGVATERRRRRRGTSDAALGRRLDLES